MEDKQVFVPCSKCGGTGVFHGASANGGYWTGVCFKCEGSRGEYVKESVLARRKKQQEYRNRKKEEKRVRKQAAKKIAIANFLAENQEIAIALSAHADNDKIKGLQAALDQWGQLTEKQCGYVLNIARKIENPVCQYCGGSHKIEECEKRQQCPQGRVEIVGTVLSIQDRDTEWGTRWCTLILTDDGYKVWGTEPSTEGNLPLKG